MEDPECTCPFHWFANLDKSHKFFSNYLCSFNTSIFAEDYKDAATMEDVETKYHVIVHGGFRQLLPLRRGFRVFQTR